jgi:GTP cyclohydrolase I
MEKLFLELIQQIGEDPHRAGLKDTPKRAAKAFEFLTKGYHENLDDIINNALFECTSDNIVAIRNIELFSICEHHLLPFIGQCHIGYIPKGKVLGLSKFARIVDHFAQRLQIQEGLTQQIAEALSAILETDDVGVIIEAKHLCMMMRGVEKQHSSMTTSVMHGCFRRNPESRNELLKLLCL